MLELTLLSSQVSGGVTSGQQEMSNLIRLTQNLIPTVDYIKTQNQASTFSHGHNIWFPDSLRYCTESLSLGTNLRAPAAKKGRIQP